MTKCSSLIPISSYSPDSRGGVVSRSSQSLFFECLASLNRRPKLVLLLTWGGYMLAAVGRRKEGDGGFVSTILPRMLVVLSE
jgi:hypothetical protein